MNSDHHIFNFILTIPKVLVKKRKVNKQTKEKGETESTELDERKPQKRTVF